ncbi:cell division protein FtsL [Paenibacillus eucommiae]|uniref:Cell division protein FtsL n=1 Tax=Paenibacillus eucommiae TaxID=1355755 RepID=A0ABS4IYX6_9BACL|nr:cell division protein FtsL [Paenibacillus eucommiae]MBP1992802.1 cell division protein FtsL [Paenibacillus eucommiae]
MPSYIQGNLAVNKKPDQKVTIKETRKIVYRTKSLPMQEKMLYLFTVLLCVVVAVVIIWRYAQIYQMNADMLKMQHEIKTIQAENSALKQDVEKLLSIERLEEEAKKLGFKPRSEGQVDQITSGEAAKSEDSSDVAYNP